MIGWVVDEAGMNTTLINTGGNNFALAGFSGTSWMASATFVLRGNGSFTARKPSGTYATFPHAQALIRAALKEH